MIDPSTRLHILALEGFNYEGLEIKIHELTDEDYLHFLSIVRHLRNHVDWRLHERTRDYKEKLDQDSRASKFELA